MGFPDDLPDLRLFDRRAATVGSTGLNSLFSSVGNGVN